MLTCSKVPNRRGSEKPRLDMKSLARLACLKYKDSLDDLLRESKRKGNFVRIYPAKGSEFYEQFSICSLNCTETANSQMHSYLYSPDLFSQDCEEGEIKKNQKSASPEKTAPAAPACAPPETSKESFPVTPAKAFEEKKSSQIFQEVQRGFDRYVTKFLNQKTSLHSKRLLLNRIDGALHSDGRRRNVGQSQRTNKSFEAERRSAESYAFAKTPQKEKQNWSMGEDRIRQGHL